MTTVSNIVTQSLRESNLIAVSANPTTPQANEAIARLQAVVLSVLGNEVGYVLEDWDVITDQLITKPSSFTQDPTDFTVPPQARLICNLTEATTLDLDPNPTDGQRVSVVDAANNFNTFNLILNGNGRLIEGVASKTLNTALTRKQWVFRSDQANWILVDPLVSASEMPFPEDFDDYFIIMLAMRLNPRYGRELTELSKVRLEQQRSQIIARYSQTRLEAPVPRPETA